MKVLADWFLLEGTGGSIPFLSACFWQLLTSLHIPWLEDTSLQSLPLSPHGLLLSVCPCLCVSLLTGSPVIEFRAHFNLVTLHLN